ncbi:MAG TPA: signal recognition particle-docking protein FtsY [Chthonomonadales bacterium]|nr:signal recognition particle-docking protein FtsY [Chthonomonadales bacterium]
MRLGFVKSILQRVDTILTGRGRIDDELLEELEAALLQADVNVRTTEAVLADLRQGVAEQRLKDPGDVRARLREDLARVLHAGAPDRGLRVGPSAPSVYLVVGVNGVGKTTTIAKLAARLRAQGSTVLLAAGDTFRAAAIEQLTIWGERIGVDVVRHRDGADPSAVIYDAIASARARGIQYVIADTAGRLHTRANLMEELRKIDRVVTRELGRPADETLLVLDATTGQNGIAQARRFQDVLSVTGVVLAKLDGTARGGIVITIADELKLPIKLAGVGERAEDLCDFEPDAFVEALLR